jgi:sugar/nucleoside kinase (ribokinase family)
VDLTCVGDVMLDVHAASGTLAPGGDVHGRVLIRPGGTSANAAVWAVWAGARAAVVAAVGEDLPGELCVSALRERGVDTAGIRRCAGATGAMLVLTEEGERSMVADRGANALLSPDDLPPLEAGAVLVSGYLLLQEPGREVALAAFASVRTSLLAVEAASWPLLEAFGPDRFFEATRDCDALLANDEEARALTGKTGADAARALGERYRLAAVKRGAAGATLWLEGALLETPGEPTTERDPTGAGDAFDGVLLGSLALGLDPPDALARAAHAGALAAGSRETWPDPERGR